MTKCQGYETVFKKNVIQTHTNIPRFVATIPSQFLSFKKKNFPAIIITKIPSNLDYDVSALMLHLSFAPLIPGDCLVEGQPSKLTILIFT